MAQPLHTILRSPITQGAPQSASRPGKLHDSGNAFGALLQQKISQVDGLKFSAHAQDRIRQRGIDISTEDMEQLSKAMDRAADKGANDTLLLQGDSAYLVNVKNRVVVTAMDQQKLKDDIFTNIDSVALVPTASEAVQDSQDDGRTNGQDLLARMPLAR